MRLCQARCGFAKKKRFSFKFLLHPRTWLNPWAVDEKFEPKPGLSLKQKYWKFFSIDNDFQYGWETKVGPVEFSYYAEKRPSQTSSLVLPDHVRKAILDANK